METQDFSILFFLGISLKFPIETPLSPEKLYQLLSIKSNYLKYIILIIILNNNNNYYYFQ